VAQGGDDFGHPLHRGELLHGFVARHEADLRDTPVGAQRLAQGIGFGALRPGLEKKRDLRVERDPSRHRAKVVEQRIASGGERKRDPDDQRIQRTQAP
jgi:hypothetical protein